MLLSWTKWLLIFVWSFLTGLPWSVGLQTGHTPNTTNNLLKTIYSAKLSALLQSTQKPSSSFSNFFPKIGKYTNKPIMRSYYPNIQLQNIIFKPSIIRRLKLAGANVLGETGKDMEHHVEEGSCSIPMNLQCKI